MITFLIGCCVGGIFMMSLTIWATSFQGLSRDEEFFDILNELSLTQDALRRIQSYPYGPTENIASEALRKCKISKAEELLCPKTENSSETNCDPAKVGPFPNSSTT